MQLISIAMQQISVLVFTSLGPTWCSQHGDGQGAEGHRTSLGLGAHQAPWGYYSLCLFCARSIVCFINQFNDSSFSLDSTKDKVKIHLPSTSSFITTEGGNWFSIAQSCSNLKLESFPNCPSKSEEKY